MKPGSNKFMKQTILNLLKKLGLTRKLWEEVTFLGKNYKVIKGSLRLKADKDDAWLFALSGQCQYIFDIGCNIGQAAIMMLHHKSIRKIILVDPNPAALSVAAENLIHNNLSIKANFVTAFISDAIDQSIEFYTQDTGAAGSKYKGFAKTAAKLDTHYTVKTLTVDFLSQHYQIIPELVKIDVEGAEKEVLEGAIELASKKQTMFFVEIHSGPEMKITDNTKNILDWCTRCGYQAWYLKEKVPLSVNAILQRGRYHALLLPEGMNLPESLLTINESDPLKG